MKMLRSLFLIVVGLFLGLGLATFTGCGEDTAKDNVEEAGEKVEEGAEDAADEVEQQLD